MCASVSHRRSGTYRCRRRYRLSRLVLHVSSRCRRVTPATSTVLRPWCWFDHPPDLPHASVLSCGFHRAMMVPSPLSGWIGTKWNARGPQISEAQRVDGEVEVEAIVRAGYGQRWRADVGVLPGGGKDRTHAVDCYRPLSKITGASSPMCARSQTAPAVAVNS